MNSLKYFWPYLFVCVLFVVLQPLPGAAQQNLDASKTSTEWGGQHDFGFGVAAWKTHLRHLQHPLTGSSTWIEYEGTSVVRKIWNGRANMAELEVDGPTGHVEGLSLRLYNPPSHQWSLDFASSGTLSVPTIGEFKNGRGEFYDREESYGRMTLVRSVWSDIPPNFCHFEQAFSRDGVKSWEVNWIAQDTRIKDESDGTAGPPSTQNISPPSSVVGQLLDEAWWTGPLRVRSAALHRGHFLIESHHEQIVEA